jgi:CDP-diacylglycerol--glycerol-3-phosphate 3-phosphatidyltransferase
MHFMKFTEIFKRDRIWTYSNFLSVSRLFIGVLLYYFIISRHTYIAVSLAIIGVITDYADGWVARKRGETSELGKILDPVADKVAIALGSVGLYQAYGLPLWIVVVIISRDILILIGSIFLIDKVRGIVASEMPGKIAVSVVTVLLLSYMFEWRSIQQIFLYLTFVAIIFSFLFYLIKFINILRSQNE